MYMYPKVYSDLCLHVAESCPNPQPYELNHDFNIPRNRIGFALYFAFLCYLWLILLFT